MPFYIHAQWELRASMGLNFVNMPDVKNYINDNFAPVNNQVKPFSTTVEFGGEVGYNLTDKYQLGLETAYEFNSFNYNIFGNNYLYEYHLIMPSLIGYYYIKGEGYNFKFGCGFGPRFILLGEVLSITTQKDNYSSSGFGGILKIAGNTALSKNVFAYIAFDIRYNSIGKAEKIWSQNIVINNYRNNLEFNALSAGLKLGISYIF
jgi:hypothetical protein